MHDSRPPEPWPQTQGGSSKNRLRRERGSARVWGADGKDCVSKKKEFRQLTWALESVFPFTPHPPAHLRSQPRAHPPHQPVRCRQWERPQLSREAGNRLDRAQAQLRRPGGARRARAGLRRAPTAGFGDASQLRPPLHSEATSVCRPQIQGWARIANQARLLPPCQHHFLLLGHKTRALTGTDPNGCRRVSAQGA